MPFHKRDVGASGSLSGDGSEEGEEEEDDVVPLPPVSWEAPQVSDAGDIVTLQVQNVEFEMQLRPGVHKFLAEMAPLFCIHLYTMGSREYVQQALHHLDPKHEIFKPGQVLTWNPALDRTTKTLQRLLCVPELVIIVDDSPMAWSQHLPNLLLIDRFVGDAADTSLELVELKLKQMHAAFFDSIPSSHPPVVARALAADASGRTPSGFTHAQRREHCALPPVPESSPLSPSSSDANSPLKPPSPLLLPQPSHGGPSLRTSEIDISAVPSSTTADADADAAAAAAAASRNPAAAASAATAPVIAASAPPGTILQAGSSQSEKRRVTGSSSVPAIADVRSLLAAISAPILAGVDLTFAGPQHLLVVDGKVPPEVELARRFGASIRAELQSGSTHLLVPPMLYTEEPAPCARTAQLLSRAEMLGISDTLQQVDARWLVDSISKWRKLPEADYRPLVALHELAQPSARRYDT